MQVSLPMLGLSLVFLGIIITTKITISFFFLRNSHKKSGGKSKKSSHTQKPLPQPAGAWPLIGHMWQLLGRRVTVARIFGAMADQCGPIFAIRIGNRQAVVMSEWEEVKKCFTSNDTAIAMRPDLALGKYLNYDNAAFTTSPYGRYWREIRKLSTVELLSSRRLETLRHVRESEVNSCIKNLYEMAKFADVSISLGKRIECMSFNIALCTIVGKRFSPDSYEEKTSFALRIKEAIASFAHLAGLPVPSDYVPFVEWMDFWGYIRAMKKTHREIDMILGHWLDEHLRRRKEEEATGTFEERDFMDVMLANVGEDFYTSGFDRETVIKATALALLLTGSESTYITLTWAISLLLNNPKALKLAQEELDLEVGEKRWVEESDISNLPYMQAIIKETLRLYPPSPLTGPREAQEDCQIGEYHVSKGSMIYVNIWKLHRDPRVWTEPEEFRPERFLNEKKDVDYRGQNFEYIPFSLGRRACPGMTFGLQVVHLMLARLVQGFDMWTEDSGLVDMSEGLGLALPKTTPVYALLVPRLSNGLYETL